MDPNKKKDKRRAVLGTILFHALILILLIFAGLKTPLPLPEEQGVLVALGFSDQGFGDKTPFNAPLPAPSESQPSISSPNEEAVTQTTEESVAIPEAKPKTETKPKTEQPKQPKPDTKTPTEEAPVKEEEVKPVVDPRALFPGRDDKTTAQQNQGETGGDGVQGKPTGQQDGGTYDGQGSGSGVEFSLSGRKANYLPIPEYTSEAQGRVVVAITVNKNGQITRATAGARGTTTTDRTLWNLAEEAAKKARFDVQQNAPEEQTGTITYRFIRIN
jgi:TonB family protein